MAASLKFVRNPKGLGEILKSQRVGDEMLRKAQRVAQTAGPGNEASVRRGRSRVRASVATVTPQAKRGEAKDRRLTRAFGAARG